MTHTFESAQAFGIQNPWLRHHLAKGWQFDGTIQAQCGVPITLLAGSRSGLANLPVLRFTQDPGAGDRNPNNVIGWWDGRLLSPRRCD